MVFEQTNNVRIIGSKRTLQVHIQTFRFKDQFRNNSVNDTSKR